MISELGNILDPEGAFKVQTANETVSWEGGGSGTESMWSLRHCKVTRIASHGHLSLSLSLSLISGVVLSAFSTTEPPLQPRKHSFSLSLLFYS